MNFLNLKYFLVTAEEMSITKAAKRLYISQQALSAHITNLEKEFGVPLFSRAPGFTLTYAGKCLVRAGKQMMDIRRRLDSEIDEILGELRGELRIGTSYTRGQALLPYVLPRFCKKYPSVEIKLREDTSLVLQGMLTKGEIDILLTADNSIPETADAIPLAKEQILLAVPYVLLENLYGKKAPAMREKLKSGTSLGPFAAYPFIMLRQGDRVRAALDEAFARESLTPNILLETENIQTAFALAKEGLGITAYPEMFLSSVYTLFPAGDDSSLCFFPVRGMTSETIYAGFRRFHKPTPAETAFLNELKSLTSEPPFLRLEGVSS